MGSILLVESDPVICDQWATAVSAAGHAVLAVGAIREALPLIREGGIDAVVIDAYDPRGAVIDLARSLDNLPDAPPIILVSGSPEAPEISARIGAAMFLPKPCEPAELVAAIGRRVPLPPGRSVTIVDEDEVTVRTNTAGWRG